MKFMAGSMPKKKRLIITGSIVALVIAAIALLILLNPFDAAQPSARQRELAETRSGLINDHIRYVPISELEYNPTEGVDYSPEDIEAAYTEVYKVAENVTTVTNKTAVYDGTGDAPDYSGDGGDQNIVAVIDWSGLGDYIEEYAYQEWNEPGDSVLKKLTGLGDVITEYVKEQIKAQSGDPGDAAVEKQLDTLGWSGLGDAVADYIDENMNDPENGEENIDWHDFAEVVETYVTEDWGSVEVEVPAAAVDEPSSTPGVSDPYRGLKPIKAEDFPIGYKTMGRPFYRETLTKKQQRVYDVIATCIQRGQFQINCDFGITPAEGGPAVRAVLNDHPEFFFIDGFGYETSWMVDGEALAIDSNTPNMKFVQIALDNDFVKIGVDKAISNVNNKTAPIIAKGKAIRSQAEKVKYIADTLCEIAYYTGGPTKDCKYSQNLYSSLVTGETVCAGYARGFQYLAAFLHVEATIAFSEPHAFNLTLLDGDYYLTDVTWMDNDPGGEVTPGYEYWGYEWLTFNDFGSADIIYSSMEGEEGKMKSATQTGPNPMHKRMDGSAKLPAAEGTKYSYKTWIPSAGESSTATPSANIVLPSSSATETTPPSGEDISVIVDGVDISNKLQIKEMDKVWYAEGETLLNAIGYEYEYTTDNNDILELLGNYDVETDSYWIDDEFKHFLDYNCIFVGDDSGNFFVPYILMIDTNEVWFCYEVNAGTPYYKLITISEIPRYVDGKAYIPMEAFAAMTDINIEIH